MAPNGYGKAAMQPPCRIKTSRCGSTRSMAIAERHRAAVDKACAHIPGRTLPEAMIRIACGGVSGVWQTAGEQRRLHCKVTSGVGNWRGGDDYQTIPGHNPAGGFCRPGHPVDRPAAPPSGRVPVCGRMMPLPATPRFLRRLFLWLPRHALAFNREAPWQWPAAGGAST